MSEEIVKGVSRVELMARYEAGDDIDFLFKELAEKHSKAVLEDYIKTHSDESEKVDTTYAGKYEYTVPDSVYGGAGIRVKIGGKEPNKKDDYGRVYSDLEGEIEKRSSAKNEERKPYEFTKEELDKQPTIGFVLPDWLKATKVEDMSEGEPIKKKMTHFDYEHKLGTVEFYTDSKDVIDEDLKSVLQSAIKHIDGYMSGLPCTDGFIRGGSRGVWYKKDLARVTEMKENAVKDRNYDTAASLRHIEDRLKKAINDSVSLNSTKVEEDVPRGTYKNKYGIGQKVFVINQNEISECVIQDISDGEDGIEYVAYDDYGCDFKLMEKEVITTIEQLVNYVKKLAQTFK